MEDIALRTNSGQIKSRCFSPFSDYDTRETIVELLHSLYVNEREKERSLDFFF